MIYLTTLFEMESLYRFLRLLEERGSSNISWIPLLSLPKIWDFCAIVRSFISTLVRVWSRERKFFNLKLQWIKNKQKKENLFWPSLPSKEERTSTQWNTRRELLKFPSLWILREGLLLKDSMWNKPELQVLSGGGTNRVHMPRWY